MGIKWVFLSRLKLVALKGYLKNLAYKENLADNLYSGTQFQWKNSTAIYEIM